MTRKNNEQTDLTDEALRRAQGFKKAIEDHRARESPITKEMREKWLN